MARTKTTARRLPPRDPPPPPPPEPVVIPQQQQQPQPQKNKKRLMRISDDEGEDGAHAPVVATITPDETFGRKKKKYNLSLSKKPTTTTTTVAPVEEPKNTIIIVDDEDVADTQQPSTPIVTMEITDNIAIDDEDVPSPPPTPEPIVESMQVDTPQQQQQQQQQQIITTSASSVVVTTDDIDLPPSSPITPVTHIKEAEEEKEEPNALEKLSSSSLSGFSAQLTELIYLPESDFREKFQTLWYEIKQEGTLQRNGMVLEAIIKDHGDLACFRHLLILHKYVESAKSYLVTLTADVKQIEIQLLQEMIDELQQSHRGDMVKEAVAECDRIIKHQLCSNNPTEVSAGTPKNIVGMLLDILNFKRKTDDCVVPTWEMKKETRDPTTHHTVRMTMFDVNAIMAYDTMEKYKTMAKNLDFAIHYIATSAENALPKYGAIPPQITKWYGDAQHMKDYVRNKQQQQQHQGSTTDLHQLNLSYANAIVNTQEAMEKLKQAMEIEKRYADLVYNQYTEISRYATFASNPAYEKCLQINNLIGGLDSNSMEKIKHLAWESIDTISGNVNKFIHVFGKSLMLYIIDLRIAYHILKEDTRKSYREDALYDADIKLPDTPEEWIFDYLVHNSPCLMGDNNDEESKNLFKQPLKRYINLILAMVDGRDKKWFPNKTLLPNNILLPNLKLKFLPSVDPESYATPNNEPNTSRMVLFYNRRILNQHIHANLHFFNNDTSPSPTSNVITSLLQPTYCGYVEDINYNNKPLQDMPDEILPMLSTCIPDVPDNDIYKYGESDVDDAVHNLSLHLIRVLDKQLIKSFYLSGSLVSFILPLYLTKFPKETTTTATAENENNNMTSVGKSFEMKAHPEYERIIYKHGDQVRSYTHIYKTTSRNGQYGAMIYEMLTCFKKPEMLTVQHYVLLNDGIGILYVDFPYHFNQSRHLMGEHHNNKIHATYISLTEWLTKSKFVPLVDVIHILRSFLDFNMALFKPWKLLFNIPRSCFEHLHQNWPSIVASQLEYEISPMISVEELVKTNPFFDVLYEMTNNETGGLRISLNLMQQHGIMTVRDVKYTILDWETYVVPADTDAVVNLHTFMGALTGLLLAPHLNTYELLWQTLPVRTFIKLAFDEAFLGNQHNRTVTPEVYLNTMLASINQIPTNFYIFDNNNASIPTKKPWHNKKWIKNQVNEWLSPSSFFIMLDDVLGINLQNNNNNNVTTEEEEREQEPPLLVKYVKSSFPSVNIEPIKTIFFPSPYRTNRYDKKEEEKADDAANPDLMNSLDDKESETNAEEARQLINKKLVKMFRKKSIYKSVCKEKKFYFTIPETKEEMNRLDVFTIDEKSVWDFVSSH